MTELIVGWQICSLSLLEIVIPIGSCSLDGWLNHQLCQEITLRYAGCDDVTSKDGTFTMIDVYDFR
jgi:hypothetical protein